MEGMEIVKGERPPAARLLSTGSWRQSTPHQHFCWGESNKIVELVIFWNFNDLRCSGIGGSTNDIDDGSSGGACDGWVLSICQGIRGDQVAMAACRPLSGDVVYDNFSLMSPSKHESSKNNELDQRLSLLNPREIIINPTGMDSKVKEQLYRYTSVQ